MHFPRAVCTGLAVTRGDGFVEVRARRRLFWVRAGGDALVLALLLAVVARCAFLAATADALWALGAALGLLAAAAAGARLARSARRDCAAADRRGVTAGDMRFRRRDVAAVAAEGEDVRAAGAAPGIRVTCVGGVRHVVLFRGAPAAEREEAAAALREVLDVGDTCAPDREAEAATPEDFV